MIASNRAQGKKKVPSKSSSKKAQKKERIKSKVFSAPVIQGRINRTGIPSVSESGYGSDGRMRVRHREYIGDVSGSVDFAVSSFSINPGMTSTFPWLAALANRFESYLFRKLSFEYETSSASSTAGAVMLAVDYDAADSPPASKQQVMSYHNAVRSGAWQECCFSSDQMDLRKFGVQRYVRKSALSPNLDIKTYDVGNLFVATKGEVGTDIIGELYVSYDVELITPQFSDPPGSSLEVINCTLDSIVEPFLNPVVTGPGYALVSGVDTLVFADTGVFNVTLLETGTVFNGNNVVVTPTNCTIGQTGSTGASSPAATSGLWVFQVKVTAPGGSLKFDFNTPLCATTLTGSLIQIIPY